ncbi:hypothetical protein CSUB8523_0724 [Campylobacter subantarcticus LMG 24377]|uniref:Uncharacterized protein n=1 Tax=Campylobacter subantarcticus TaxID=497724 RepID=A0ABW9N6G8_9BACT|nr:hypothetical protein [Campylobacter subantarcticus]AJC92248.1 hypothetical protein CSUB8523_0724 [Campylobacter subantarcticus LMG 24377]EAL3938327.1 hypothetical protein [Campylobacter lari]MPB99865.1 hypothetical protein [Campylobacter subantarcticus]
MGFRGNIYRKYDVEYGGCYFNYGFDDCVELLSELDSDLILFEDENSSIIELNREKLLSIDISQVEHEELKGFLEEAIEVANTADYSKKHGYVRVEWF